MGQNIRMGGVRKIAIGAVGGAVAVLLVVWLKSQGYVPTSFGMIPLAIPGAYALMGLLELVTGVEFARIAQKWDDLAGWQRGVLGLIVVILAFVVMMGAIVLFG